MHSIVQLEKQQVGLRLPTYLIEQMDEFVSKYNVNRTDIIVESIKSYLAIQQQEEFYKNFDTACKEVQAALNDPKKEEALGSLEDLIDELENHSNN